MWKQEDIDSGRAFNIWTKDKVYRLISIDDSNQIAKVRLEESFYKLVGEEITINLLDHEGSVLPF